MIPFVVQTKEVQLYSAVYLVPAIGELKTLLSLCYVL